MVAFLALVLSFGSASPSAGLSLSSLGASTTSASACGCSMAYNPVCGNPPIQQLLQQAQAAAAAQGGSGANPQLSGPITVPPALQNFKLPPSSVPNSCVASCLGFTDVTPGLCPGTSASVQCSLQNQCSSSPVAPICIYGQTFANLCQAKCTFMDLTNIYPTFPTSDVTQGVCVDPCLSATCGSRTCQAKSGKCVAEPCTNYFCYDQGCSCSSDWGPVCSGGITFTNPCYAACFGITNFTDGQCTVTDPQWPNAIPIPATPVPKVQYVYIASENMDCLVATGPTKCPIYRQLPSAFTGIAPLTPGTLNFNAQVGTSYILKTMTQVNMLDPNTPVAQGQLPWTVTVNVQSVVQQWTGGDLCPNSCPTATPTPVCGSDGKKYNSECLLNSTRCSTTLNLTLAPNSKCGITGSSTTSAPAFSSGSATSATSAPGSSTGSSSAGSTGTAVGPNCQTICPFQWQPVCGSDGSTYGNLCTLTVTACLNPSVGLTQAADGACPSCHEICPAVYTPICGSDGVTYPNQCSLDSAACRGLSVSKQADGACAQSTTSAPAATSAPAGNAGTTSTTAVPRGGDLAPARVTVGTVGSSTIQVSWTAPTGTGFTRGTDLYGVEYRVAGTPPGPWMTANFAGGNPTGRALTLTISGLKPSTAYSVRVNTWKAGTYAKNAQPLGTKSVRATTTA